VRVIAGALKGRRLVTPRGATTRPTADQVRIALMDTLMPWLPGARVLDLFAGAGGVGLEALSRGAAHATFVEREPRAVAALRCNIAALGVEAQARVLAMEAARALDGLAGRRERFEVVFLDPPYESDLGPVTVEQVARHRLAAPGGVVIAQHFTKRAAVLTELPSLTPFRARRFGETTLTFFRARE
jgi:16S rRNA (guanine966-N2)-methyltransferase